MRHTYTKNFRAKLILVYLTFLLLFLTSIDSFPCPTECICKPNDMTDNDFIRMNYIIDCSSNVILNGSDQLIYRAQSWSIHEDKFVDDQDSDIIDDYIISIDLSNSLFLKQFNNQTIQLTGFSFSLQSLSLARQSKYFQVESNAFSSILYQNLKILNLSSCCQHIPINCSQIFRPLKKLQILDLSGSDMYRSCLNTPGRIFV